MESPAPTPWIEHLGPEQCWPLVGSQEVGRVGVLVDSAPEIYTVNHIVDGDTVLFRTAAGTKLRGLERSPQVCFQVDHTDSQARGGWSVLLKGRSVEVTDSEEIRAAEALINGLWAFGEHAHWIRVVPNEITGRRLGQNVPRGGHR